MLKNVSKLSSQEKQPVEEEISYDVERIDKKMIQENGRVFYFIKWKDYPGDWIALQCGIYSNLFEPN